MVYFLDSSNQSSSQTSRYHQNPNPSHNMKLFTPLVFASAASAHTIFSSLEVGGINHGVGGGIRVPQYNGPVC